MKNITDLICKKCIYFMDSFDEFTGNPHCRKACHPNKEKNNCLEVVWK